MVVGVRHPSSADFLSALICSSEAWATAVPPGLKRVSPCAHVGLPSGSEITVGPGVPND